MRIVIPVLASLVLCAGIASAGAEELAPETAATDISQSSGLMLVDLFAHW